MMPADVKIPSAATRPLPFAARADLSVHAEEFQGRTYWVVKDPLSGRYYRFGPEEYAVLQMLDGRASAEQISTTFGREFSSQILTPTDLLTFLLRLNEAELLVSHLPDAARQLKLRRRQARRVRWRNYLQNPAVVPLAQFDPQPWLRRVVPWIAPALTWSAWGVIAAAVLAAGVVFGLAPAAAVAGWSRGLWELHWGWLALALWLLLNVPPLAGGLVLYRLGGNCREARVELHGPFPVVRLSLTDAWHLPRKRQRLAVSTAGLGLALLLASAAFLLWLLSPAGAWRSLWLGLWVVAVAQLVLREANPLSGGQAYLALCDVLGDPNLSSRGRVGLHLLWGRLLGVLNDDESRRFSETRARALAFAAAEIIWRWVAILLVARWAAVRFCASLPSPMATALMLALLGVLVAYPAAQLWKLLWFSGRLREIRPQGWAFVALILAMTASVATLPLSVRRNGSAVLHPSVRATVTPPEDGTLIEMLVRAGESVAEGQPLARIRLAADSEQPLREFTLTAPAAGIVLPAHGSPDDPPANTPIGPWDPGRFCPARQPLVLIARTDQLELALGISNRLRRSLHRGDPVWIAGTPAGPPAQGTLKDVRTRLRSVGAKQQTVSAAGSAGDETETVLLVEDLSGAIVPQGTGSVEFSRRAVRLWQWILE